MKLSLAAELAVRGAMVLADHYGEGPITLETICSERDLPKQYLVKIFGSLAKAGLIIPVRGKRGGYLLTREPKRITLLQLVEAVEGPIFQTFCQQDPPKCKELNCPMRPIWAELQHIIRDKLGAVTLDGNRTDKPASE